MRNTGQHHTSAGSRPNEYRSIVERIRGPIVPVMPAFADDERFDLESARDWIEWLIKNGIGLFWTTYGISHFFSLTDDEIMKLTKAVSAVTRRRALFIASTSFHWPVSACMRFIEAAATWGVDAVKLQIDWRWHPAEDAVLSFNARIAEASPLPLFAYTNTEPSQGGMKSAFLARLLDLPQFVGMKNDAGDFYEHCEYLRVIRLHGACFTPVNGGSMMSFLHGRNFGAQAFATSLGMFDPGTVVQFSRLLDEGRRDDAVRLVTEREEPFIDLCRALPFSHWAVLHAILLLNGRFASSRVRFPLLACSEGATDSVRRYPRERGSLGA